MELKIQEYAELLAEEQNSRKQVLPTIEERDILEKQVCDVNSKIDNSIYIHIFNLNYFIFVDVVKVNKCLIQQRFNSSKNPNMRTHLSCSINDGGLAAETTLNNNLCGMGISITLTMSKFPLPQHFPVTTPF